MTQSEIKPRTSHIQVECCITRPQLTVLLTIEVIAQEKVCVGDVQLDHQSEPLIPALIDHRNIHALSLQKSCIRDLSWCGYLGTCQRGCQGDNYADGLCRPFQLGLILHALYAKFLSQLVHLGICIVCCSLKLFCY